MKYVPGLLVGVLSRKAGSTVASHNRFGPYLRNRVIPVNPATTNQILYRTRLTGWSQAWRALTSTERAGWTALGATMSRLDSLGVSYTLTGLQAYTSLNVNLQVVGAGPLNDAPALSGVTAVATCTPTATA